MVSHSSPLVSVGWWYRSDLFFADRTGAESLSDRQVDKPLGLFSCTPCGTAGRASRQNTVSVSRQRKLVDEVPIEAPIEPIKNDQDDLIEHGRLIILGIE